MKVKEEEEENEAKADLKLPHADVETQSISLVHETDGDRVDNAVTEGSASDVVSRNDVKQICPGKETGNQKEIVDTGTDSVVSKSNQMSTETFVKHQVDLSEMADDENKKFHDGAFHSQHQLRRIIKQRKTNTVRIVGMMKALKILREITCTERN